MALYAKKVIFLMAGPFKLSFSPKTVNRALRFEKSSFPPLVILEGEGVRA